jgi:hypothetical protein
MSKVRELSHCPHYALQRLDDNYGFTTYEIYGYRPHEDSASQWMPIARVYTTRMDAEAMLAGIQAYKSLCSECRHPAQPQPSVPEGETK